MKQKYKLVLKRRQLYDQTLKGRESSFGGKACAGSRCPLLSLHWLILEILWNPGNSTAIAGRADWMSGKPL